MIFGGKKLKRGLTLIETAMVLGVVAISMAGLSKMLADNARTVRLKSSSEKMIEISGAAKSYVNQNYTALTALAGPGNPIVVPVAKSCPTCSVPGGPGGGLPSLQGGGFLSSNFVDTNSMNQRHAVLIREPSAGNLEVLVTAWGGTDFSDADLGRMSAMMGSGGGAVYANSPNAPTSQVVGSFGGWTAPRASWQRNWSGNAVGPAVGRPAVALAFAGTGGNMEDYLNRFDTGDPEANRMQTHIDMNGFDLNSANYVRSNYTTAAVDVSAGRNVSAGTDVTAGRNTSANNDALAGRDARITRDVRSGREVIGTSNIRSTNGFVYSSRDNASYGQTLLRRWGLHNPSGNIYIEPDAGRTLYMTQDSWDGTGQTYNNYNYAYIRGTTDANYSQTRNGAYNCTGNGYDCRVYTSDDGFFRDLNDGWSRFYGVGQGMSIDGPNAQLNIGGVSYHQGYANFYANAALHGYDAVIRSHSNGGLIHDLVGTYRGWDADAVYLAGYNRYNNGSRRTRRVVFGGNGTTEPVYVELNGGRIYSRDIVTRTIYDRDNTGYYLNPASTSNLNYVRTQDVVVRRRTNSYWISRLLPRYVLKEVDYIVITNRSRPNIPKPSCPDGGRPKVILVPVSAGSVYNPNFRNMQQPFYFLYSAANNGSNWRITLDNGGDLEFNANPTTVAPSALAMKYCYY